MLKLFRSLSRYRVPPSTCPCPSGNHRNDHESLDLPHLPQTLTHIYGMCSLSLTPNGISKYLKALPSFTSGGMKVVFLKPLYYQLRECNLPCHENALALIRRRGVWGESLEVTLECMPRRKGALVMQ